MYNYEEGTTYKSLMNEIKSWGDRIDEDELFRRCTGAHIELRRDLITFSDDVHESWRGAMVTNIETMKAVRDSIRARNPHYDFGVFINGDIGRAIDAVRSWDKANGTQGETMTNIDHTTETLYNGTVYHTYSGGPFEMDVFDRRESDNSNPSYVRLGIKRHTYINVGVMERPFLDEPDYLIETRTSSRDCDLETLIEDAAIARDVLHGFREILLNDHQITTTLNGK